MPGAAGLINSATPPGLAGNSNNNNNSGSCSNMVLTLNCDSNKVSSECVNMSLPGAPPLLLNNQHQRAANAGKTQPPTGGGTKAALIVDREGRDEEIIMVLPEKEEYKIEIIKDDKGLGITVAGYVCEKGIILMNNARFWSDVIQKKILCAKIGSGKVCSTSQTRTIENNCCQIAHDNLFISKIRKCAS